MNYAITFEPFSQFLKLKCLNGSEFNLLLIKDSLQPLASASELICAFARIPKVWKGDHNIYLKKLSILMNLCGDPLYQIQKVSTKVGSQTLTRM
jgi:hypothetical protein